VGKSDLRDGLAFHPVGNLFKMVNGVVHGRPQLPWHLWPDLAQVANRFVEVTGEHGGFSPACEEREASGIIRAATAE
jgi:hypothetical protein